MAGRKAAKDNWEIREAGRRKWHACGGGGGGLVAAIELNCIPDSFSQRTRRASDVGLSEKARDTSSSCRKWHLFCRQTASHVVFWDKETVSPVCCYGCQNGCGHLAERSNSELDFVFIGREKKEWASLQERPRVEHPGAQLPSEGPKGLHVSI